MKRLMGILAAVLLGASACTSGQPTSPTLPPTTSTPASTETWTGTVQVGGYDYHTFNVLAGPIAITLTAAGPPATIFMGIGVGTPTDPTCTLFTGGSTSTQAGTTAQLSGSISTSGPICVEVYDIGNQAAPVSYSVSVLHS